MRLKNMYLADTEWRGSLKFDTLGRASYVTFEDVLHRVSHPLYIVFFVIIAALYTLFGAHVGEVSTNNWPHVAAVVIYVVLVFTTLNLSEIVWIYLSKRFKRVFIYSPLNMIFSITISSLLLAVISRWLPAHTISIENVLQNLPTQIGVALVFQVTYDLFVFPVIFDKQALHQIEVEPTVAEISIAGKKFVAKDLYSLSANDHYLEVKTITDTYFLRSRLADAVLQLEPVNGIMPHRSFWVARFAVDQIDTDQTPKVLKMTDGSEIPIANARFSEVSRWL